MSQIDSISFITRFVYLCTVHSQPELEPDCLCVCLSIPPILTDLLSHILDSDGERPECKHSNMPLA